MWLIGRMDGCETKKLAFSLFRFLGLVRDGQKVLTIYASKAGVIRKASESDIVLY
jgi:hypothetical protein